MKRLIGLLTMLLVYASGIASDATYIVTNADYWDNNRPFAGAGTTTDCMARVVFITNADSIRVTFFRANFMPSDIGVIVNGVVMPVIAANTALPDYEQTNTIYIGAPGVSKTVQLINGAQTGGPGPQLPNGSYVLRVKYPSTASFAIVPPVYVPNRLYILGNSIATGSNALYREVNSAAAILRRTYNQPVFLDAWGWRGFYSSFINSDSTPNMTAIRALAHKVKLANPWKFYCELGTNDFGVFGGQLTVPRFKVVYAAVVDAIHDSLPLLPMYLQTLFPRTDFGATNNLNFSLEDYNNGIRRIALDRPYGVLVEGNTMADASYLDPDDHLHLTTVGQAHWAEKIYGVITGNTPPVNPTVERPKLIHLNGTYILKKKKV